MPNFQTIDATNRRFKLFDSINIDSKKWYEDTDGNVRVPIILAKTGILDYKYVDEKGDSVDVREAKLPSELLTKSVLFSFEGKPVTNEHPPEMLNPSNYHKYAKGAFINPKIVGDSIHGEIVIYDKELQDDIKSGERYQVSPGFWSSTEYKKGEFEGGKFDAIQKDISGNHVAIVKEGRAGDAVRIKLDSKNVAYIKNEVIKMKNKTRRTDAPEDDKKIDEYNAEKEKSEKDDEFPPADDKKPEAKKEDEDKKPEDEDKKDDETSPEAMLEMIEQLQTENKMLKEQLSKTDNTGKYMESRDFAIKYITDKPLNLYHDSAEYYKRAVVDAAGVDLKSIRSAAQLEGAYSVAKLMLEKESKFDGSGYIDPKMDAAHKSELQKAIDESEKNNSAFIGKRKVTA